MKQTKTIAMLCLLSLFTLQSSRISADSFAGSSVRKGNVDGGTLAVVFLSSFLIGNAIAWAMGAYPQDFPKEPYSEQELNIINDLASEIEENPDEIDVKVELGELYFHHNDLDKAGVLLEQAVTSDREHAEALAVYSANEAKQAGAMLDLTWGLRKLNRMDRVVEGLNRAVLLDPENFKVRLYRLNTLIGFKNQKGAFHKVFEDEAWFLERQQTAPDLYPQEVKRAFYQALFEVYTVDAELSASQQRKTESLEKSFAYRALITPIATGN